MPRILSLAKEDLVTAVMTGDDEIAIGLTTALLEAGKSVPGDISITGFDNIEASQHVKIPLTTVDVPKQQMIDLLLSDLFVAKSDQSCYELCGQTIVRESVGIARSKEANSKME